MDNRFAVIDLGSNTFHILIVDINEDGTYTQVHKERSFVGLAEKGIETICDSAVKRGKDALAFFSTLLTKYNVNNYKAIGTSALRTASNSQLFVDTIFKELNLKIDVIGGDREAELIYHGVSTIADTKSGTHVIMDVGGGSVEFILIENDELVWSKSSDIGVGVLYNLEQLEDPLSVENIKTINEFLDRKLLDLRNILTNRKVNTMIGASGSFEVIQSINGDEIKSSTESEINLSRYYTISKTIRESSQEDRKNMDGLPDSRIKLVGVAFLLIDKAIEIINPSKLIVSPYALKEGVLKEWILEKTK